VCCVVVEYIKSPRSKPANQSDRFAPRRSHHRASVQAGSMSTRVFLRRNGSSEPGCMSKLPPTWAELLAVADAKLFKQPGSGVAKRIFAAAGDEIMDDDYDLIESNDILYLSCGEDWRAPAAAPPPATAVPPPEAAAALTSGEDRPPSTPVGPLAEPAASTSPAVAPTTVDASPQAAAVGRTRVAARHRYRSCAGGGHGGGGGCHGRGRQGAGRRGG
jgi:hypothetical protein